MLRQLATSFSTLPIFRGALLPGSVIALQTQGGNLAEILVSSITSTRFQFLYITYGNMSAVTPNITRVLNIPA